MRADDDSGKGLGLSFDPGTNLVDVYIKRLREKIDAAFEPKLLHTVRGTGYVLRAEHDDSNAHDALVCGSDADVALIIVGLSIKELHEQHNQSRQKRAWRISSSSSAGSAFPRCC